MRALTDAREDARTRRDAAREAEDVSTSPENRAAYVEAKVKEARAAREAERKRQQNEERLDRDKVAFIRAPGGVWRCGRWSLPRRRGTIAPQAE